MYDNEQIEYRCDICFKRLKEEEAFIGREKCMCASCWDIEKEREKRNWL